MKHAFTWALSFIFALSALGSVTVPLETEVCGQVEGIQSWSFEQVGQDHQAYLRVTFLPTQLEGRTVQANQRFKINNLVWDKNFKNVLFQSEAGLTVCGRASGLGTRLEQACGLEFKVREMVKLAKCSQATVLEGIFFVR